MDINNNFSRSWTNDVPYLTDELGFCPNCLCHVPVASVAAGFCDFCKPEPKERPTPISSEISSLIPAEAFEEKKQQSFLVIVRQQGHALRVVLHVRAHVLLRVLSVGLFKPKPVHSFTFFRERGDQSWVLVHAKKEPI